MKELKGITRLEVIDVSDECKRKFVRWDCKVMQSIQDNGRTMKLFVYDKKTNSKE